MNAFTMLRKGVCLVLVAMMMLSTCGASAYADEGVLPPPLPEDGVSATEEPAAEPSATEEPVTEPPATEEPVAEPPVTEEPVTEPPATEGSVTEPPATEEPVAEPPATEEPVAVPPVQEAVPETPAETQVPVDPSDPSEDPLYERWVNTPMTIAAIPATFDSVKPRALRTGETLRKGVDVSEFQVTNKSAYNIDWNAAAASGIEFAIVRVGYRGVKAGQLAADNYYAQNLAGAKAAGLKVGAYIFSQAVTPDEAREEARYLMNIVSGYSIDLPLVFDYEEVTSSNRRLKMSELDRQLKTDICNAFCDEVEAAGYQSMVYANPTMLNKDLYRESLGRLWLAHWTAQSTPAGEYEFWQFGLGAVSGFAGEVDLDYWFDPNTTAVPPMNNVETTPTPAVSPTPTPGIATPPETTSPFTDVSESNWFCESVLWAYGEGIVDGMGDGTFAPGKTATRGQVTTMIYRMMGKPSVTGSAPFNDLKADYYKDAINWAAANKVVNGTSATTFGPNGQITREDLVTMLYRMAGSPAVTGSLNRFRDGGSVKPYAQSAMLWAIDKGLIQGYANNTIQPGAAASRAEVCTLLMRYSDPA